MSKKLLLGFFYDKILRHSLLLTFTPNKNFSFKNRSLCCKIFSMKNDTSNKNNNIRVMIKGLFIGGTMLVPGVSGGTMAMILGIYDNLISSVSSFMKNKTENFRFLLLFAAGGILGMFLFSRPILYLIENFTMPTLFFFMGAVIGGVPFIFRKSQLKKASWKGLIYIAAGIIIVLGISFIPAGGHHTDISAGGSIIYLVFAGFIAAVALILPGISVSYMLLIMGLYDRTMMAISQAQIPFLIPLAAGLILGIILTARVLENAMNRFPQPTYLIILGFVLGSLAEVFPGVPSGIDIAVCAITFAAGAAAILILSKVENDQD